MRAPFPYFGGKSRVVDIVWHRFGKLDNYVEPFAGSAAMLLGRPPDTVKGKRDPQDWGIETINDADGLVSNFWRALQKDPEEVSHYANWPVNEADLHARHLWLIEEKESLTSQLMADPDWYNAKAAGWWVWGSCAWIGQGWCRGDGCWNTVGGEFVKGKFEEGVNRQIPHLGDAGRGINRYVTGKNKGIDKIKHHLLPVADRLRNVRVACGDWSRVVGYSVTDRLGITGIFLDPPYSEGTVDYNEGDRYLSSEVRYWILEAGTNEKMRIALCGYTEEHDELENHGWIKHEWKASGGYGSQGEGEGRENANREVIWFSPHCLSHDIPDEMSFDELFQKN